MMAGKQGQGWGRDSGKREAVPAAATLVYGSVRRDIFTAPFYICNG